MRAADNPFASHRIEALAFRPAPGGAGDGFWHRLVDRLGRLGWRAAVVGGHGRGKTTLLDGLAPRLVERGFTVHRARLRRFDPPRAALAALPAEPGAGDLLLVDGAGCLGPAAAVSRARLLRRSRGAGGLVVTAHRRWRRLPTLIDCAATPALLAELVAELLGGAGGGGDPAPPAGWPPLAILAAELHARHRGDVRAAFGELYDRCAGRGLGGSSG